MEAGNQRGEIGRPYLSKGRLALVEGRLQTDHWTDDKGEAHYRAKVVARHMQRLDHKPEEQDVTAEAE